MKKTGMIAAAALLALTAGTTAAMAQPRDYYGDDFESKTIETVNANYDWEKTLTRFGVDTVLMPPGSPLTCVLKESRQWRVVYDDGVALVFRPASQALGNRASAAIGDGSSRDREVTNTATRDPAIAKLGSKT